MRFLAGLAVAWVTLYFLLGSEKAMQILAHVGSTLGRSTAALAEASGIDFSKIHMSAPSDSTMIILLLSCILGALMGIGSRLK